MISGPIYTAIGFGENEAREMFSVPFQQITYTYNQHEPELSDEKKETIAKFLPLESFSKYESQFADPIKEDVVDGILVAEKGTFLKLWASLLVKYPADYVSAFLALNSSFWYPGASALDHNGVYIEDGNYYAGFAQDTKWPAAQSFYWDISHYHYLEDIPLINSAFSLWFPFWFSFFCLVAIFFQSSEQGTKARRKLALIFLPAIFLWLTYLLGPTANFRYVFPIFLLYPLYLALILKPDLFIRSRR